MFVCLTLHSVCQQTGIEGGSTRHIEREREIVPVILHAHTHAHKGTGRGWTKFVRHADCRPPGRNRVERRKSLGRGKRERERERLGATRDAAGGLSKTGMIPRHGWFDPRYAIKRKIVVMTSSLFLHSLSPAGLGSRPSSFGGDSPGWFPGQGTGILIEARGLPVRE